MTEASQACFNIVLAPTGGSAYTEGMSSEPEEINNDFNSWDCFGASLMLGITPAILNFVFNDKEIVSTVILAGIGFLIACAVWLLAVVTRWRLIGVLVNLFGSVLTCLYIGIAVYMWWPSDEEEQPADAETQEVQQEAGA